MNATEYVKDLLDKEVEICKHTTQVDSLRKIIAFLKTENYVIYSENCECGLGDRKHKSYVKDWAV
tara:strand:- start:580 stop:774 length:195 start_codon:yes stop_codon:yes gene_type:complete